MASPTSVRSTGDPGIDALLTGHKWDDTSLSFSFPGSGLPYVTEQLADRLSPLEVALFLSIFFSPIPFLGGAAALRLFASTVTLSAFAFSGFEEFNDAQKASVRLAHGEFMAVSPLFFSEGEEGNLTHQTLRYAETGAASAPFGIPPLPRVEFLLGHGALGDVWLLNNGSFDDPAIGNFAGWTILHEIGHQLGLKHGHEPGLFGSRVRPIVADALTDVQGPTLPPELDSHEFTVMTYRSSIGGEVVNDQTTNEFDGYPQSLMMLDIQAIQHMYGANFDTNSDNTVYTWDPNTGEMFIDGAGQGRPSANRIFRTVWDGGGFDIYDFSKYASGVTINLNPGEWTTTSTDQLADLNGGFRSSGLAKGNIANALLYQGDPRSFIENAIGGSGDDVAIGNEVGNRVFGGVGNDTLYGLSGDDGLSGGPGADVFEGGDGRDSLFGGAGMDTATYLSERQGVSIDLVANTGADFLVDIEIVYGSNFGDTLLGGTYVGDDGVVRGVHIKGWDGDDRIIGGDEREAASTSFTPFVDFGLDGGAGNDRIEGRGGDDLLIGGDGNDTLLGGEGADLVAGGSGSNLLFGGGGGDTIGAGEGSDVMFGDDNFFLGPVTTARDRFNVSFSPASGSGIGQDVIADFQSGTDVLIAGGGALFGTQLFQALDSNQDAVLGLGDEFVQIVTARLDDPESGASAERESVVVDLGAAFARAAGTEATYVAGSNAVTFFGVITLAAGDISGGNLIL